VHGTAEHARERSRARLPLSLAGAQATRRLHLDGVCRRQVLTSVKFTFTTHCISSAAGYVNYIYFHECIMTNGGLKFVSFVLQLTWFGFLMHLVEGTTNE
jgi:hypothetical protein